MKKVNIIFFWDCIHCKLKKCQETINRYSMCTEFSNYIKSKYTYAIGDNRLLVLYYVPIEQVEAEIALFSIKNNIDIKSAIEEIEVLNNDNSINS